MNSQDTVTSYRAGRRRLAWVVMACLALAWIGCVSLWVRSYAVEDGVVWTTHRSGHYFRMSAESARGVFQIDFQHQTPRSRAIYTDPDGWDYVPWPAANASLLGLFENPLRKPIGYEWHFAYAMLLSDATPGFDDHMDHEDITRTVWCRDWVPTAVLTLAGLLWARRLRRGRRRPGDCTRCGYDLAGNASGVCPECGTTIVVKGSA